MKSMIAISDSGQKAQDYTTRNSYVLLEYCSGWNIAIYAADERADRLAGN